ncbi:NERD domain-containing protein [Gracilibacillus alcaliphilus]|uniref:NERD domain-containing protein n=1 Tax=Gracilibacillus alcaliphilus TaxID=1401441 RepID=UPI00195F12D9|nr:NERD domain-containing protein [Gracilibacillus alcaliphilus]MBM7679476.1 hypothetical protein [Gracilibacillus alcaliphilus]
MAQLIKLENYISRYQQDIYHYPAQFTRLKKENWQRLKVLWEQQLKMKQTEPEEETEESNFFNWRSLFHRRSEVEEVESEDEFPVLPQKEEELKQFFLDTLLPFQLRWASTTINQMSFLDREYHHDSLLRFFLQRMPDTYFIMYLPIFELKSGIVNGEVVMITPLEIEIIMAVEQAADQTLIASEQRYWHVAQQDIHTRTLSPLIALKRTETIVQSILKKYELEMPIKKVVLSRANTIEFQRVPYRTDFIGKEEFPAWLQQKQQLLSPIKHNQLKVTEALLRHVQSVSVRRPEWDSDDKADIW